MGRSTLLPVWFGAIVIALAMIAAKETAAESGDGDHHGNRRPVYQRHAFEWKGHGRNDRRFGHKSNWIAPQVNAGWFQRPYPYHLDYYKMRYGGSYAPYFGNLYGPPQVVTAPPYYGPYFPGETGYGGYGFPASGGEELPVGAPAGVVDEGVVE